MFVHCWLLDAKILVRPSPKCYLITEKIRLWEWNDILSQEIMTGIGIVLWNAGNTFSNRYIRIWSFNMAFGQCYDFYNRELLLFSVLTHWGQVTHICIGILTNIASDNGLVPTRRQAIIWTNVGILFIRPLGTNFSEILIEIHTFSRKCVWK